MREARRPGRRVATAIRGTRRRADFAGTARRDAVFPVPAEPRRAPAGTHTAAHRARRRSWWCEAARWRTRQTRAPSTRCGHRRRLARGPSPCARRGARRPTDRRRNTCPRCGSPRAIADCGSQKGARRARLRCAPRVPVCVGPRARRRRRTPQSRRRNAVAAARPRAAMRPRALPYRLRRRRWQSIDAAATATAAGMAAAALAAAALAATSRSTTKWAVRDASVG